MERYFNGVHGRHDFRIPVQSDHRDHKCPDDIVIGPCRRTRTAHLLRTCLPGLWGAGEVTSSGLHGANRLASNSLLEALVYGAHTGEGAAAEASCRDDDFRAVPLENPRVEPTGEPLNVLDIRNSLKSLMWRNVGVRRDADGLQEARETIEHWCRYVLGQQFTDPTGWELQNMLIVARLMIQAALDRQETRGCHVRTDYPDRDDSRLQRHTVFRRDDP